MDLASGKKPLILPPRLFLLSAKRWIIRIGIAFMKHVQTMTFNISTTKKHGLSRNHLCFPQYSQPELNLSTTYMRINEHTSARITINIHNSIIARGYAYVNMHMNT